MSNKNHQPELGDFSTSLRVSHLHRDHTVAQALDRMAASRMEVLPVVRGANIRQLEGVVTLQDVLARHGVLTPHA